MSHSCHEDANGGATAGDAHDHVASADSEETNHAKAQRDQRVTPKHEIRWSAIAVYGVRPGLVLMLALAAAVLKWQGCSIDAADVARAESVRTARDSTVALLSYRSDTVDKQLAAARELLTGQFRGAYTSLTNDVVIPGAKQKRISAATTVPAAASVSATPNHAVVLVFIDQTVTIGSGAPSDTASSVRVTLDNLGDRWLISGFDPV
jgi:Mce-associated membrane protein